jgi:hypothetical protein
VQYFRLVTRDGVQVHVDPWVEPQPAGQFGRSNCVEQQLAVRGLVSDVPATSQKKTNEN